MAIGAPSVVTDFPTTTGGVGVTTNDCPAGNLIVVLPYCDNLNGTVTAVTDSAGNIYTQAVATATQSGQFTSSIWYCTNCLHLPAGGTIHIVGVPTAIDMTVYFVTGANGGLDVTNSNVTNTNVTTISLATGTLAQADEIIIGLIAPANSPSPPTASGFTQYDGAYGFYKIVSSTASQTFAPVWTGSAHASAVIATFKATAASGVSVSGQPVISGQGIPGYSSAKSVTGQAATSAQGTLIGGPAPALAGQPATSAQGTLAISSSKPITGQSATSAQGAVTFSTAAVLAGQSMTANQGAPVATVSPGLAGQAGTAAQGSITLGFGINKTISGQSMTANQGLISIGTGTNAALTGQAATATQGSLTLASQLPITGQSTPANQGVLTSRVSVSIIGQALTAAQGNISLQYGKSVALTGQSLTSSQGSIFTGSGTNVVYEISRAFYAGAFDSGCFYTYDNHALTMGQGAIKINTNVAVLSGRECTVGQGAIGIQISKVLPGQVMTSAPGVLDLGLATTISGVYGVAQQGGDIYVFFPNFFIGSGEEVYVPSENNYLLTPAEDRNIYVLQGDRDLVVLDEDRTLPVPEHRGVYGGSG